MASTKLITTTLLQQLGDQAAASARLRTNHNLHPRLDDPVQRFLNALRPGTYVRPHRHTEPARWECFLIISGHVSILLFDDAGRVTDRHELEAGGPTVGLEIPPGQWHGLVAIAPSVLFELKQGPYVPSTDKDFAAWAPDENSPQTAAVEAWYRQAVRGDRFAG